jgi:hypothetical protein
MRHDRSYRIGPIQVTKHALDWCQFGPDFGDFALLTYERIGAMPSGTTDHYYFNPAYTVTAPGTVLEAVFLQQARRACILWMKQIDRVLGSRARKRAVKRHTHGERMLVFSGTLVLQGRSVHIKRLNESSVPPAKVSC